MLHYNHPSKVAKIGFLLTSCTAPLSFICDENVDFLNSWMMSYAFCLVRQGYVISLRRIMMLLFHLISVSGIDIQLVLIYKFKIASLSLQYIVICYIYTWMDTIHTTYSTLNNFCSLSRICLPG